jgi:hypothetical protein
MADAKRITSLLDELSDLATQLNTETDSINEIIKRCENTLRALNLGLEVWLEGSNLPDPADLSDEDREEREGAADTELGFCRYVDRWTLCLRSARYRVHVDGYNTYWTRIETSNVRPLLQASRAERLASLGQFEDLLTVLRDTAKQSLESIQAAKSFVEQ